uniref:Uncharacterized protein n=1 Tax=viral metagenome TaxID=1070528 RepID=A0A6M3JNS1_9ZZZZ
MTYQERLDKIEENAVLHAPPRFSDAVFLCRELIDELEDCMSKPHSADYDELDRLRKRDEVVRGYIEKGLELEDKHQPDTTWSCEARVLAERLAAIEEETT